MLRNQSLQKILAETRASRDHGGPRRAVVETFSKTVDCGTLALGAEVYTSETERLLVCHTCKLRACPSRGDRATGWWQDLTKRINQCLICLPSLWAKAAPMEHLGMGERALSAGDGKFSGKGGIQKYSEHLRLPFRTMELHPVKVGKTAASILLDMIGGRAVRRKPVLVKSNINCTGFELPDSFIPTKLESVTGRFAASRQVRKTIPTGNH